MQELVGKLISGLEKEKPSPISLYLFHLYHRFECLRGEEMETLDIAKHMLEYGVNLEAEVQLDVVELNSNQESLSFTEQWKILAASPGSWKKQMYQVLEGRKPVQFCDWKVIAMMSFDFEDDLFRRIWEEIDQLQGQYSKLEFVTKGASKLLGNCRPGNIVKELKKLKQNDMVMLEATNATLLSQVSDLKVKLAKNDEEIPQLKE